VKDVEEIYQFTESVGYPIFLKLDKGGGGKGIEMVSSAEEVLAVFDRISRIGTAAFGSSDCYLEKVVVNPRHLEVQFLGDFYGKYVCLGERECSIQRRHQKIIEESPSPIVTKNDRELLFDYTLRLAQSLEYQGAGTIEGLRSESGDYSFMEINARLQVEHPVTEFLTGVDIVQAQLRIASGEPLALTQEELNLEGHAIQARIYAEDPVTFAPSPGIIEQLKMPNEDKTLRIDHALEEGGIVPPFYDPLLAKVIAWGDNREQARLRLIKALKDFQIDGVSTTIPLNISILEHPKFQKGVYDTSFIETLTGVP
jgi:acetyl-CoA carboxylase biotin carboxylase subunit